jgi:hypothetical protein
MHSIIAVSRDIHVKKTEEQQLELLESVITNTNESVIMKPNTIENRPKILYVNPFTKMLLYSR